MKIETSEIVGVETFDGVIYCRSCMLPVDAYNDNDRFIDRRDAREQHILCDECGKFIELT